MSDRNADLVHGNRTPRRRSLWPTIAGGVLAVAVLAMISSQRTLTAPMPDTVDMADMTWVEVRSAIDVATRVAIVPTGGIEQNGAHMVLGKHDYIVRSAASALRKRSGGIGDAGGVIRAGGQLRSAERQYAVSRHARCPRTGVRAGARGYCAEPQVGWLQDHLLYW